MNACQHTANRVACELKRWDIGSMNARLRKIIKTRGHFPGDDAATRLIWLALRNITADWGRAANHWKTAMNPFAILCEARDSQRVSRKMETNFSIASAGTSQAPSAAVEKSHRASHTEMRTLALAKVLERIRLLKGISNTETSIHLETFRLS